MESNRYDDTKFGAKKQQGVRAFVCPPISIGGHNTSAPRTSHEEKEDSEGVGYALEEWFRNGQWLNLHLLLDSARKQHIHLGWNGQRLARGHDLLVLCDHYPEVVCALVDWIERMQLEGRFT